MHAPSMWNGTSSTGNCYRRGGVVIIALIDWKAANGSADDVSHSTVSEEQPASTSVMALVTSLSIQHVSGSTHIPNMC